MPKKVKRESQKDRKKRKSMIQDDNGGNGKGDSKNEEEKVRAKQEKAEEEKEEKEKQTGGWFSSWFGSAKTVPVEEVKVDDEDNAETTSESEEESVDGKEKSEEKSVEDKEKSKEESKEDEEKSKEELANEKIRSEEESNENKKSEEESFKNKEKPVLESVEDEPMEYDLGRKGFILNEEQEKYEQNSSSESEKEFLNEPATDILEMDQKNEEYWGNVEKDKVAAAVEQSHSASESEMEFKIEEADRKEPVLLNDHLEKVEKQNKLKEMSYSSIESENEFRNENDESSEYAEKNKLYFLPLSQGKSHSSSESDTDFDISEFNQKCENGQSYKIKESSMCQLKETNGINFWKEAFAKMKSGDTWDNPELQKNFSTMKTKHIDHEQGFGCISHSEDPPSVKAILKETSPFFNNETKMTNFRLSNFHFYSLGFHVFKSLDIEHEDSEESVYLFRHFLHTTSLTSQQLESLKVVACKLDDDSAFDFIKPIWIDETFICVAQTNYTWFQVLSESDHLPVQINLVPFRQTRQSEWQTIFICPLPPGRLHIQKMLNENVGWRKCGYEEPCIINKGVIYQFFDQDDNEVEACGQIKVECRSEDTLWIKYGQDKWRNQAFITAILRETDHPEQAVFVGQISLYETLRLDEDLSAYDLQNEAMDLSKLDGGVLADIPFPGSVTYVDPFLQHVRQGRLTLSQLSAISAHMGYPKEEKLLEDTDMTTVIKDIMENWKDEQGRDASIVNFLTILGKSDVSLTNIAMEIYQNITNSQWI